MNPVRQAWHAAGAGLKAFTMTFTGRTATWYTSIFYPRSNVDYRTEVTLGMSSAVMACINFITRAFPEAPFLVWKVEADGTKIPQPQHPLVLLLQRPNPHYSGLSLWSATLADLNLTGNAFWLKARSGARAVAELYFVPSWMLTAKWPDDGSEFLTHYEYRPDASKPAVRVDRADVVHFRYNLDPANVRMGLSPLASVFREVFSDDEATNFSAALLRNMGIPGVLISPDKDAGPIDQASADAMKERFQNRFSGDRRGEPMVMTSGTKVQVLSFTPEQLQLRDSHRIPEERISAVLGVPAIVAGLGAGLDRSTFANMSEAREMVYESNLIPTQRLVAAEIEGQLLPDFDQSGALVAGFDLSSVRVLQEDQAAVYARQTLAVTNGWITVAEARSAVGLPTGPEHDIYLVPTGLTPTSKEDLLAPPEPPVVTEVPLPQLPAPAKGRNGGQPLTTRVKAKAATVPITDDDLEDAADDWDTLVPAKYAGLLDATVVA